MITEYHVQLPAMTAIAAISAPKRTRFAPRAAAATLATARPTAAQTHRSPVRLAVRSPPTKNTTMNSISEINARFVTANPMPTAKHVFAQPGRRRPGGCGTDTGPAHAAPSHQRDPTDPRDPHTNLGLEGLPWS